MQQDRFEVSSRKDRANGRRVVCYQDFQTWKADVTINRRRRKFSLHTRDKDEARRIGLDSIPVG